MKNDIGVILEVDSNGNRSWSRDGQYHRIGGPAVEYSNGEKHWMQYNVHHRVGGPAVEKSNGVKWWCLYDEDYSEEEYNHLVSNLPLLYWNRFKRGEWI
jgi:hypothetical protein